ARRDIRLRPISGATLPRLGERPAVQGRLDPRYRADEPRGGPLPRERACARRCGRRGQPHRQVAGATQRALPETLPVQIGAMLGVRRSRILLVVAAIGVLAPAGLARAAGPGAQSPPVSCAAVEQRLDQAQRAVDACEEARQATLADRAACGEDLS